MGGSWSTGEIQSNLGGKLVSLVHVAATTARHHIIPRVFTAARARHYMVEALGGSAAVLTTMTIPAEHRPATDWNGAFVRDLHIRSELYD